MRYAIKLDRPPGKPPVYFKVPNGEVLTRRIKEHAEMIMREDIAENQREFYSVVEYPELLEQS